MYEQLALLCWLSFCGVNSCGIVNPAGTSSTSSTSTSPSRCRVSASMVSPFSSLLSCQRSNSVCYLDEGVSTHARLFCPRNEVMIGSQCITLAENIVDVSCSDGAVTVKVHTHSFGDTDRWNNVDVVTISNVDAITCSDCPDACVFGFAHESGSSSATEVLALPTNSLCSLNPTAEDLDFGDLGFVCKVPSGMSATLSVCEQGLEVLTSTEYNSNIPAPATFDCVDGILTESQGRIGGNVFGIICDQG